MSYTSLANRRPSQSNKLALLFVFLCAASHQPQSFFLSTRKETHLFFALIFTIKSTKNHGKKESNSPPAQGHCLSAAE